MLFLSLVPLDSLIDAEKTGEKTGRRLRMTKKENKSALTFQ